MRRRMSSVSMPVVLLAVLWSQSSLAQGNCGDIEFDDAISDRFANAKSACLEVVERDGREYAHFEARIVRVRGNEVQVEFKQPDGSYGRTVSFTPPADARVRIGGRSYRYRELSAGQELDAYVPPDLWAIAVHQDPSADFMTAEAVTTVPLAEEPTRQAARLPSTAGKRPWIAFLGVMFIALAALAGALRLKLNAR